MRNVLFLLLAARWSLGQAIKIAFVGDTGMEDERNYGYGHLTMKMLEDQGVDLVVDVGDFDYWGRCSESYDVIEDFEITSITGRIVQVPADAVLKRFKWQDGHETVEGWEIGVVPSQNKDVPIFHNSEETHFVSPAIDRLVISERTWYTVDDYLNQTEDCFGYDPWDGPFEWDKFLRRHNFDFLGASGNTEVMLVDLGGPEVWASHQTYMHALYMERIYNTQKGACHGYFDPQEPGSVEEYGDRYSCYYKHNGSEDFHFIFLGWWQGSDEHWNDQSTEERRRSIDFIDREFNSSRSRNVRWRFCIHHMTSAKLSAGDSRRDAMTLSGITDACRRHGAIIVSGHHHLYSRTKLLDSVGGETGEEPVTVRNSSDSSVTFNNNNASIIQEGVTVSLTVGMGGYDSSCNGQYVDSPWMEICVASLMDHRGAVIAEFDEETPWTGTFQYLNSMDNAMVVDEFVLTSRLPGWNSTVRLSTEAPTTGAAPEPDMEAERTNTETPTTVPVPEPGTEENGMAREEDNDIILSTEEPAGFEVQPDTNAIVQSGSSEEFVHISILLFLLLMLWLTIV
ncbi:hypothetical protein IV203_007230 [Nitzschia inconspicua]|uniref:Calcineurin-like phosphoesterase domain-containing protein n=1 Tax=Nitzschia inconspicua TaxID=303405 RepID=A0A9K3KFH8_9STRA|nr:hypothetical protein IV203_007230 [Nitzschia inconspicua]